MEYLTGQEIKNNKARLKNKMEDYVGRNLQNLFAANIVAKYHDQFFKDRTQTKVLDFGVAGGAFARQLYELGFHNIAGLDIEDYLADENKQYVKEFKTADLSYDRLPWPDNSVDIATAWCVLAHLENPYFCIRETYRILKPGGLFILSIPHLLSRASINFFLKHGDFARYYPGKNHISVFTPGVFQNAVSKHFKKVNMEYLIDPRSFSGFRGFVRKQILSVATRWPKLRNYFEKIWGYNQIWILQK